MIKNNNQSGLVSITQKCSEEGYRDGLSDLTSGCSPVKLTEFVKKAQENKLPEKSIKKYLKNYNLAIQDKDQLGDVQSKVINEKKKVYCNECSNFSIHTKKTYHQQFFFNKKDYGQTYTKKWCAVTREIDTPEGKKNINLDYQGDNKNNDCPSYSKGQPKETCIEENISGCGSH